MAKKLSYHVVDSALIEEYERTTRIDLSRQITRQDAWDWDNPDFHNIIINGLVTQTRDLDNHREIIANLYGVPFMPLDINNYANQYRDLSISGRKIALEKFGEDQRFPGNYDYEQRQKNFDQILIFGDEYSMQLKASLESKA